MSKELLFEQPFSGTFMGLPLCNPFMETKAKACILGVPFDCGTHPFRVGSREGPDAVRQQSRLLRHYDVDPSTHIDNPTLSMNMVDVGNIRCEPGCVEPSYKNIESAITMLINKNIAPISIGGDGAVSLPQLRALSRKYPDLTLIHIDAHTDTYNLDGYNTATTFTRAAEENLIVTNKSFHVGARGLTFTTGVLDFGRSLGYNIVPFGRLYDDMLGTVESIKATIEHRPVYLCFDMDIFDPSCAPGVCTPEWGGLSAKEGLDLVGMLFGLNVVACDINTVSPAQDVGNTTAHLAAAVVRECCSLVAANI